MNTIPAVGFETLQVVSDGAPVKSFVVEPSAAPGTLPIVLLLHDWWGLTDHVKKLARRFAESGYLACAPDLYSRLGSKTATDPAEASQLMGALSAQQALRDLNAITGALKKRRAADPRRIAVVGFSMGGAFALTQACHNSDLKAAVVFYGKIPPIDSFKYLLCPVQYHWPDSDPWIPKKEVDVLRAGLAQAQRPGEIIPYPRCKHGFFNDTRPEYNPQDAERAWNKTLEFLSVHVR